MSLTKYYHRSGCRLCGSVRVERALHLEPTPVADAYVYPGQPLQAQDIYPLDLYLCRDCGHVQLMDVVDPEILFHNYTYMSTISLGLVEHFRRYAEEIVKFQAPAPGSLVVDIGSNDGSFLRCFKEKGLRVLGVDPAREIAVKATAAGIETIPAFFTSELACTLKARHGAATLVAANNVFAHSDVLSDMCDGVRALLAPDGIFVFEVAYLLDLVENMLFDTVYHEHLCYHSVAPLQAFLDRHALQLVGVKRIPSKGGSIRCIAQHKGGRLPPDPLVGDLRKVERDIGLDSLDYYRRFAEKIETIRSRVSRLLSDIRTKKEIVAGYGASATVTTLLYNLKLQNTLEYLVDDNPAKHGSYSPGVHLRVLPSSALLERKPDYVIILAWQYADSILKRNEAYLKQGGHFIVPVPDVKVI
jgi:hypothetical protein